MKNIGVFCGSGKGTNDIYSQAAKDFGQYCSKHDQTIVYGGGNIGLMGVIADEALKNGGDVIGVIPDFMIKKEIAHKGLSRLIITQSMHERKIKMAELSDAFIALPGGYGTIDEISEMLTFTQLRFHQKPVGLYNINGYFDHFIKFADHLFQEGFVSKWHRSILVDDNSIVDLMEKLQSFEKKDRDKWLEDHEHIPELKNRRQ